MNTPDSPEIAHLQQRLADMEARYQRYQEMFPGAINRIDELDREVEALRAEVKAATATIARQGEELASLREAVWPGKPEWKPTTQEPQQDFSEAFAECLWSNNRLLTKIKVLIHEDEEVGLRASQELAENPIGTSPDSSTGTADDAIPSATVEAIREHLDTKVQRPCSNVLCQLVGMHVGQCDERVEQPIDTRTERPIQAGDRVRHKTEGWIGRVGLITADGYYGVVKTSEQFHCLFTAAQLGRVDPEKGEPAER